MLSELRIQNLGVISDSTLNPAAGMTALTGETGAGKTMVVSGLGLLLGRRSDSKVVRIGSSRCLVEGTFGAVGVAEQLARIGAEIDDGEVLVTRQITAAGRSRAFVGGVGVPLGQLSHLAGELATIHGQSEQVRLGSHERQREVLDRAGGPELAIRLADYQATYRRSVSVRAQLAELTSQVQARAREHDLLEFGLGEIGSVDPQPGEDVALAAEAAKLQTVDDLRLLAERVNHLMSGSAEGDVDDPGAAGLIAMARKDLRRTAELDPAASQLAETAEQLGLQASELAVEVASYLADLDADPLRLEAITQRRAELHGLTRKYGQTVDDVLAWAQDSKRRLAELGDDDERITQLQNELSTLDAQLVEQGQSLTHCRAAAADGLAQAVGAELAALAMPHARLRFDLVALDEPGPWGLEQVHLMFTANPGSPPAPLAKVASGGELSRVRLALEVVLAKDDPGHVFVFDEVDAGIGGAVATEVGRRLARLAEHSQVIVVTHLAQVAAFAQAHYVVSKSSTGEVTTSDLRQVDGEQRIAELARMMGGKPDSKSGLAHARELLAAAQP